jgi:DNA mismatch repair protein MutS
MGDFYEIFGDDAINVSALLNIVLTKRDKGESSIPFCGVPHHSARSYWLKLLKMNYKIAIADQVEEASQAKGLVRRELTKFITPACIDDWEGLQSDAPNYLMFAHEDPHTKIWISGLADVSTGELRIGEFTSVETVVKAIETYKPKELLVRRFLMPLFKEKLDHYLAQEALLFTPMPEAILRDSAAQNELVQNVLGHSDSFVIPIENKTVAIAALASVFTHLSELKFSLGHFLSLSPLHEADSATLNSTAINDLELFTTVRQGQQKGSLFHEINCCLTPMGARCLRWGLTHPLLNQKIIEKNHDIVSHLYSLGEKTLLDLRSHLQGITDIERLLIKLVGKTIKPKELVAIRDSLEKSLSSYRLIKNLPPTQEDCGLETLLNDFITAEPVFTSLFQTIKQDVGTLGNGDEVFHFGFDIILDQKNELSKNGEEKVEAYQEDLRKKTGISSLKIKNHKNFGLLIEVTKTHFSKVPEGFIRRQTMVNCERYITVELQELNDALLHSKEDAIAREAKLYDEFLIKLTAHISILKTVSRSLADFDKHQSFAWLALQKKYCRPEITKNCIELKSVRHPTVESFVGAHAFNPNDLFLNERSKQMLITGPNMGGKSTIMRTLALCALLNQCGGFVPARSAKMPIFDQIFTRVGASDDLVKGLSTFMVEMTETASILRQARQNSLVILDEVGRGTSTEDGLAIASAILENLATKVKSWTLFATHYHELVQFSIPFSIIKIYQTEVIKTNGSIRFTHRLIEGASGSSYGIQVAKLAGIPEQVIARAHELLNSQQALPPRKMTSHDHDSVDEIQQLQLQKLSKIVEELSINRTTPIQALNILVELKNTVSYGSKKGLFQDGQSLF